MKQFDDPLLLKVLAQLLWDRRSPIDIAKGLCTLDGPSTGSTARFSVLAMLFTRCQILGCKRLVWLQLFVVIGSYAVFVLGVRDSPFTSRFGPIWAKWSRKPPGGRIIVLHFCFGDSDDVTKLADCLTRLSGE